MSDPAYEDFSRALSDPSVLALRATFVSLSVNFEDAHDVAVLTMPDPAGDGHATTRGLAGLNAGEDRDVPSD